MHPINIEGKRAALGRHFLFSHLTPEELERIASIAVERHYPSGQVIFQQGDEGSRMMVVLRGLVRISGSSAEGKEFIMNVIEPGGFFGEIAVIDGKTRSANATAVGETALLLIDRGEFFPLLQRHPELTIKLLMVLCQKLRDTSSAAEALGLFPIPVRLARLLLKLADSAGETTPVGVRVEMKLSQGEIGSLIGATRESVNKQLRSWEHQHIIALEPTRLTILKGKQLAAIAESFG